MPKHRGANSTFAFDASLSRYNVSPAVFKAHLPRDSTDKIAVGTIIIRDLLPSNLISQATDNPPSQPPTQPSSPIPTQTPKFPSPTHYQKPPPNTKIPHILLLRRASHEKFPNQWEIPGGGAENRDVSLMHAAAREAYEETGLVVTRFIGDGDEIRFLGSTGRRWAKVNFEVEVAGGDGAWSSGGGSGDGKDLRIRLDPYEHRDWKWVTERDVIEGTRAGGWGEQMLDVMRASILRAFERRRAAGE